MVKEVLYYKKLKNNLVQCQLCPRTCVIKEGMSGDCKARKNVKGVLYSLIYGKLCAIHVDPIEKKPLYHFLPGTLSYSIGTAGCNLHCDFCQNWTISQAKPEDVPSLDLTPEKAVESAIKEKCKSISYTYTEPLINYEYVLETAKIAKRKDIKNILVNNGFINKIPLKRICQYVDAANIDLKGNDQFYRKVSHAWLKPVLESLKTLKKEGVWLEITNLLIPTLNDDEKWIEWICKWIKNNLGNVPLHFSRFYPEYKLLNIEATPLETLEKARKIASKYLDYVYLGNIHHKANNTYCPECKNPLIKRSGFGVVNNYIKNGTCSCGKKIIGVF